MKSFSTLLSFAAFLGAFACSSNETGPSLDSKSNWFSACQTDAECDAELSCFCGVCTQSCDSAQECSSDGAVRCLSPEDGFSCVGSVPLLAVCVQECSAEEDCESGSRCDGGICSAAPVEVCPEDSDMDAGDLLFESELLTAMNMALNMGYDCATLGVQTRPLLGQNAALTCAARLHAAHMEADGFEGPLGPDNRSYITRVSNAGYGAGALDAIFGSGEDAQGPLSSNCELLFDPDFAQIGIGVSGDSWVVIVGQ